MLDYLDTFTDTKHLVKFQRKIIDLCADGLMVVNKEGRIVYINRSFQEIHGVDESVLNKHITEILANTRMHIVAQSGVAEHDQFQIVNNIPCVVSRIPLLNEGECVGVVGFIRFTNVEAVKALTDRVKNLQNEISDLRTAQQASLQTQYTFEDISAIDPKNKKLKEITKQVALTDATVLLQGESGSGKEIFAHSIHDYSRRRDGPFIRLNCSAIQDTLIESELFGYEKGAFTGAHKDGRKGKFELADGGTIFLDEIGDMPLGAQVKLLRVIQEREIDRLGSEKPIKVNVRVIAATNRNLEQMVAQKTFREDLFYRLNVIPLHLFPLRETPEEIPQLAQNIWRRLSKSHGIFHKRLSPDAILTLCMQEWKGNIRELRNILERLMIMIRHDCITAEDVQDILQHKGMQEDLQDEIIPQVSFTLNDLVEQTEKKAVRFALDACNGNRSKAARMLGVSRPQLYKKMNKYEID